VTGRLHIVGALARGLALLGVLLSGCAGASPEPAHPERAEPVPGNDALRRQVIGETGRELYDALARAEPETLLLDDVALRKVLEPKQATRFDALRLGLRQRLDLRPEAFALFRQASFSGVCLQGARVAPAGGTLGLRHQGWVFDRALVVGEQPSGRRVAAWVEGTFVYTNAGFRAIDLERVEEPRWEHSDLELAPCDMEAGLHEPLPVVDVSR